MIHLDTEAKSGAARPEEGDAPLSSGELLYTRTDTRGMILAGNRAFCDVAHISGQDVVGTQYNSLRHADMPDGLFHLMWKHLSRKEIFAGYIKNRAKDGLDFWLFVVLIPSGNGFISVGVKPASNRLELVEPLYADARRREKQEGASSEDSAAFIAQSLAEQGFGSHDDFANDSLSEEVLAEREVLGLAPNDQILWLRSLLATVRKLRAQASDLSGDFQSLTSVPRNFQIKAKALEPGGGPLTALSSDYGRMSHEMSDWFAHHVMSEENNFSRIANSVKECMLLNATCDVLQRCQARLGDQQEQSGKFEAALEAEHVLDVTEQLVFRAQEAEQFISHEAVRLNGVCKDMRRTLMGLNTVRVTGKIENARLNDKSSNLGEIIHQLGESQRKVEDRLKHVNASVEEISKAVKKAAVAQDRFANTIKDAARA